MLLVLSVGLLSAEESSVPEEVAENPPEGMEESEEVAFLEFSLLNPPMESPDIQSSVSKVTSSSQPCFSERCAFFMESGYRSGEGIGYDKGYSTLGMFFSLPEYQTGMPFVQGKAHYFVDGKWAFNAGGGVRFRKEGSTVVYGMNAFYDYRRFFKQNFSQMGFGFDIIGENIAFRANGYIPSGPKEIVTDFTFNRFEGIHMILNRNISRSMWGGDGEFELGGEIYPSVGLAVSGGGYFYKSTFGDNALVGKGQFQLKVLDYLIGGVRVSYDNVFNLNVQGDVRVQIPFGPRSKFNEKKSRNDASCPHDASVLARMIRRVERQEIIVLSDQSTLETAKSLYDAANDLVFIHVNNLAGGAGTGTLEDPFSVLATAEAASSANQVVYANAGDGTTTNQTAGFTMQDNQLLLSTGTDHAIPTSQGIIQVPAFTEGRLPFITNGADGIVLANNNIVEGFVVTGVTGDGFAATDRPVASAILRNRILNPTVAGVRIEYTAASSGSVAGTWAVNGNFITGGGGVEGIEMVTTNAGADLVTDIDFSRNDINNLGSDGIHFIRTSAANTEQWTLTGKINQNIIDGNGGQGIFFNGVTGGGGVNFVSPIFDLQINENQITNNGDDGIQLERGNGFMEISRNVIFGNAPATEVFLEIEQVDSMRMVITDNFFAGFELQTDNAGSRALVDFMRNTAPTGSTMFFDANGGGAAGQQQTLRMSGNTGVVSMDGNVFVIP